jgi:hypothetical protein
VHVDSQMPNTVRIARGIREGVHNQEDMPLSVVRNSLKNHIRVRGFSARNVVWNKSTKTCFVSSLCQILVIH